MLNPYYEQDGIVLYCGDCREVLPQIAPVDVVMTDPPYNARKNYGDTTNDNMPWPEWCAWWDDVLTCCRGAAPDVFAFLSQTAHKKYSRLGTHEIDWSLIWHKPLSMAVCAMPFMPHWEPIAYWGTTRKKDGAFWGSDVVVHNTARRTYGHPTEKPLPLMLELVRKLDGVICDPFAGSGTTLHAARILGRQAVGIEINERYCDMIAHRLQDSRVIGDRYIRQHSLIGADQ